MEPTVEKFLIRNITLVDVEHGRTIPACNVIISAGRIESIDTSVDASIPEDAQVIDGDGLYLMPGLVDAHVHFYDAPVFGRLMLANGVLLVRDMGMPNEYILKQRDELNRGDSLGPEMVATGAMLDGNPPIIPTIALGVETPDAGRKAVEMQATAGVDLIKTYQRLDREVFLAILDEAHRRELKVASHLPESIYLEDAAAAGLDCSEHFNGFEKIIANLLGEPVNLVFRGQAADAGYFMRLGEVNAGDLQAVYRRLGRSGLTICPTVVTFKTLTHIKQLLTGEFPGSEYISSTIREMWKSLWLQQDDLPEFIWQNWVKMVVGLHSAGVPLLVGTDLMLPGILPGFSVHEEMSIWQEAGIPPADILRSATVLPARFMGLGEHLGTVEKGKKASMILVQGDPLQDVKNARKIEGIFLRGQYFNRSDLDGLLAEAAALAQNSNQVP